MRISDWSSDVCSSDLRYASPVWMDINQSRTLQYRGGRDSDDERHISPLQLDVIERCIDLWSNPGDTVLTPFLGIGSEVYSAARMGRKGIGIRSEEHTSELQSLMRTSSAAVCLKKKNYGST